MDCPSCGGKLEFIDEGSYPRKKNWVKNERYGKYYTCEDCGAEVLKRPDRPAEVTHHGMVDVVRFFDETDYRDLSRSD